MAVAASQARFAPIAAPVQIWARPSHIRITDTDEVVPASAIVRRETAVAAITARARGAATRLLGAGPVADFQALIVARSAGLRRGRDVRDRRIGLPAAALQSGGPRVHALRGAIAVLEAEGLFFRHVQWVDLPPADAVSATLPGAYCAEFAALQAGTVDAVYVRGPAGMEAARAAGARVLIDIGAHRDPWVRTHTALLQAITVCETLLEEQPVFVADLLARWPLLPARIGLEEAALAGLETLKTFMMRWAFIAADFKMGAWANRQ